LGNSRRWIDTLCINQNDPEERTSQVELMGAIYSAAKRVVIWLGEEDTASQKAIDTMIELSKSLVKLLGGHYGAVFRHDKHPYKDEARAINEFFDRPWFKRVWAFQEAVL
ncbi:HET-domain-containing protein, partial [Zopfia rhizophila CBS 207.26]